VLRKEQQDKALVEDYKKKYGLDFGLGMMKMAT
jgi:hypothetical protein